MLYEGDQDRVVSPPGAVLTIVDNPIKVDVKVICNIQLISIPPTLIPEIHLLTKLRNLILLNQLRGKRVSFSAPHPMAH